MVAIPYRGQNGTHKDQTWAELTWAWYIKRLNSKPVETKVCVHIHSAVGEICTAFRFYQQKPAFSTVSEPLLLLAGPHIRSNILIVRFDISTHRAARSLDQEEHPSCSALFLSGCPAVNMPLHTEQIHVQIAHLAFAELR